MTEEVKKDETPATASSPTSAQNKETPTENKDKVEQTPSIKDSAPDKQYFEMKESILNEKIESLKQEAESIKNGTHPFFLQKSKELEELKKQKISAVERWKEYHIQSIQAVYEAEKAQGEDEYKRERNELKEKMLNSAIEKKKKLVEEKSSMNPSDGERVNTRTSARKRGGAKEMNTKDVPSVKRKFNPPQLNYNLKESEISDDLALIQKVNPKRFASPTKSNGNSENNIVQ
eukprot:TRINITY_DN86_c0_g2_i1.p1 TRINITY_DN86_c0_g2~~TRINITY_DN86_c0_g2_i1.p1  ORF type:complete len:232 (+),score=101.19 TRINITY_DN86_c0_g2_i1:90-785(+)